MTRYGKLINNKLVYSPLRICDEDKQIFNPTITQLSMLGYKPIIEINKIEQVEGYYINEEITEDDSSIIINYQLIEL